ncbi:MAG: toxic anion resistance protein [Lachnospiraceae bacterium]|nr:toxic anion resistance protein [Lachnospiraceae bacterium]MBR3509314.1 toxic anion resistance protein [Lachnospiraceae bacterium]MBR4606217.1 toxic anion resistance protein [Lachnospiraceae bacterium]MBR6152670.1 toxic anion resistance protein [Lachnospiraceae bacterium]
MSNELDEMINAAPTLTLEPMPSGTDALSSITLEEKKEEAPVVQEVNLTPQEQKMVDDFAAQIDITNTQQVMQYGSGSQKKIADFSESALGNVRTKDMGEIGKMLTDVVAELRSFEDEEDKGFFGNLFKKSTAKISDMKAKYDKAEVNVNKICKVMEGHQVTLLKDIAMLDKMYDLNMNYYKELSMYILAGKQKLEHAKKVELPELVAKAEKSGLPEDTQAARDFSAQIDRFEKKIYDLELTKTISLQMAPQIRLIQTNDTAMSEKIQSTLVNTIPLWKSQMVIAIGLNHSTNAARAQKEVSDMTNALLKKNAETLKIATIETAKENERGIVDIETLTQTNQTLISTLDEVMKIQEEGRTRRANAEVELTRIENEMKQKLLDISKGSMGQK